MQNSENIPQATRHTSEASEKIINLIESLGTVPGASHTLNLLFTGFFASVYADGLEFAKREQIAFHYSGLQAIAALIDNMHTCQSTN